MIGRAPLVFIASPVSSSDEVIIKDRLEEAARFAAWVLEHEEKNVLAAAPHHMAISKYCENKDHSAWWEVNMQTFMEICESCYVLQLEGWDTSGGVKLEIEGAKKAGKPVFYYKLNGEGYSRV